VGEEERYAHYEITAENATLYEHARRALIKGSTAGPHGLPLMGSGDWNDGMNRVGIEGMGESVWLGWFLYATLIHFAPLCEHAGDEKQAVAYRQQARDLLQALSSHAWDGNGIAARPMTTAHRWGPLRTANARLTLSHSHGPFCPGQSEVHPAKHRSLSVLSRRWTLSLTGLCASTTN